MMDTAYSTSVIHTDRLNYCTTVSAQRPPSCIVDFQRGGSTAQTRVLWRVVAPNQIVEILRRCTPLNARAVSHFSSSCCADVLWLIT